MSAIAAHAAHDHATGHDHAEAPANGAYLPRPRNAPSFAALSFLLACGTAPVAAFGLSLSLLFMGKENPTIGAWMAIGVMVLWLPPTVASILLSHDRAEWS